MDRGSKVNEAGTLLTKVLETVGNLERTDRRYSQSPSVKYLRARIHLEDAWAAILELEELTT